MKNERHGKIFFETDPVDGWEQWEEIVLDDDQSEQFINLVQSSNVLSDAPIKDFLTVGEDVKLIISGWTFTKE